MSISSEEKLRIERAAEEYEKFCKQLNAARVFLATVVTIPLTLTACATQSGDMSPGTASIFVQQVKHIGGAP